MVEDQLSELYCGLENWIHMRTEVEKGNEADKIFIFLASAAYHSEGWKVMLWFLYKLWDLGLSPGKGKTFKGHSSVGAHSPCSFPTVGRRCVCVSLTQGVILTCMAFARARRRGGLSEHTFVFSGLIKGCRNPLKKLWLLGLLSRLLYVWSLIWTRNCKEGGSIAQFSFYPPWTFS